MKTKQIKKLLTTVTNNFLESIEDKEIRALIKKHGYVTGGAIPCMLMDDYVNDYDIYLNNKEVVDKVLAYFKNDNKVSTTNDIDSIIDNIKTTPTPKKFKVNLITNNSINFSDKIQIVVGFYGEPEQVIKSFDFAHIKSYFLLDNSELVVKEDVYKLIFEKELVYTGSSYPLSSFLRTKKYIKKGWNITNTEMIKIALDMVVALKDSLTQTYKIDVGGLDADEAEGVIERKIKEQKDKPKPITYTSVFDDNNQNNSEMFMNVNEFIKHLNGVDPLTIQVELLKHCGENLSLSEIIQMIK